MTKRIRSVLFAAMCVLLGVVCAPALADRLHLKDGRVLEGRVEREGDGFLYFVMKVGEIEHTQLFTTVEILRVERDGAPRAALQKEPPAPAIPAPDATGAAAGAAAAGAAATGGPAQREPPSAGGATRVVFISLEDEVGLLLNADALWHSYELVKDEKPEVIVLVINSGGGALLEVQPLSDVIHEKLKPEARVVSWIRSAISAASMTAWNCEEIYMTKQGNIGGTVAFSMEGDKATAAQGEDLERILKMGEELSRRGKRNPLIMRAMQVFMELSCDIDSDGAVTWYDSTRGHFLVNPKDRIVTFNSEDALKYGVSRGTAETKSELMRAMGVHEWVETGAKADEYQKKFRADVKTLRARSQELLQKYQMAVSAARTSQDRQERNRHVGRARTVLAELRGLVRRAPSFEKYTILRPEWFAEREEELRKLATGGGQ